MVGELCGYTTIVTDLEKTVIIPVSLFCLQLHPSLKLSFISFNYQRQNIFVKMIQQKKCLKQPIMLNAKKAKIL